MVPRSNPGAGQRYELQGRVFESARPKRAIYRNSVSVKANAMMMIENGTEIHFDTDFQMRLI